VCGAAVDPLFQALCRGAEANPDEVDEDEGEFFYDEAGVRSALDAGVQAQLDAMVSRLDIVGDPAAVAAEQTNGFAPQGDAADAPAEEGPQADQE
jgi:hypothetical protein